MQAIPLECFGGEEVVANTAGGSIKRMRQNNAYLLVYERADQDTKYATNEDSDGVNHADNLFSSGVENRSERGTDLVNFGENINIDDDTTKASDVDYETVQHPIHDLNSDHPYPIPSSTSTSTWASEVYPDSDKPPPAPLPPSQNRPPTSFYNISHSSSHPGISSKVLRSVLSENTDFMTDRLVDSWRLANMLNMLIQFYFSL